MKGIQTLEELCSRYDILDIEPWIKRAVQELKPEGAKASHAVAKLLMELLECRNPKLMDVLAVAAEMESIPELVEAVRSIAIASSMASRPAQGRFESEVSDGGQVGWTEYTAKGIKSNANKVLERFAQGKPTDMQPKKKWWEFWKSEATPSEKKQTTEEGVSKSVMFYQYNMGSIPKERGLCSDRECPCDETPIPRGTGYLYVSKEAVQFMERKLKGEIPDNVIPGYGLMPFLVCKEGAELRGIDMEVAAEDARRWWETGKAPLRPTPKAKSKS
jgi:hypothetical protein